MTCRYDVNGSGKPHLAGGARNTSIAPIRAYDGTLLAASEMLLSGTTCFNDMYFLSRRGRGRGDRRRGSAQVVGMISHRVSPAPGPKFNGCLLRVTGKSVHDQLSNSHPLITTTCFAPHAPYTVDDDALSRIATLAEELDVPVHIHLHETAQEVEDHVATHGMRPLERLKRLGLVSPRLIAVHMTALSEEEMAMIAKLGVHIAHCPESNLKLASGFCQLQRLCEHGVNIGIGTDGAASNNDLDMLGEMRSAALLAKG